LKVKENGIQRSGAMYGKEWRERWAVFGIWREGRRSSIDRHKTQRSAEEMEISTGHGDM
jgi:hypothetical protein